MAKARNTNRDKAFDLYKDSQGKSTLKEIAEALNESLSNIKYWKKKDDWLKRYNPKGGAPLGNKNAVGKNCGGLPKNQNARKKGWYSKYYPNEIGKMLKEAMKSEETLLDILWVQIHTHWISIVRSQEIMLVEDKEDMTKELKKFSDGESGTMKEYEIQFAWDKQANFLKVQSTAMSTLTKMLKQYDEMLHANWEMATEEQKLRVERLKVQIKNDNLKGW